MNLRTAYGLTRSLVVYYGQPWKRRRMDALYSALIQPGDLCFDVGSHVGNRIASWTALGARVVAVEPQPDCMSVLQRLYGGREDVVLLPVGLAGAPGRLELQVSRTNPTVSTFSRGWIDEVTQDPRFGAVVWDDAVDVEVRTLDQLIAEHGRPAFVKIDVEGLEHQVLAGCSEPLPAVSVEVIPAARERAHACLDQLARWGGYTLRFSPGESQRLEAPMDLDGARRWIDALEDGAPSGDLFATRDSSR